MQKDRELKEIELNQLKSLCSQKKVIGFVPNIQFGYLRRKYPWHYILYVQEKWTTEQKSYKLEYLVNQFRFRIEKLIDHEIKLDDIEYLESIFKTIDRINSERIKNL